MHRRPVLRRRQKDRWIVRGQGQSLTGHVVESLVTGIGPLPDQETPIAIREARLIRMGDPDGNFDLDFGNVDYWRAVGGITIKF